LQNRTDGGRKPRGKWLTQFQNAGAGGKARHLQFGTQIDHDAGSGKDHVTLLHVVCFVLCFIVLLFSFDSRSLLMQHHCTSSVLLGWRVLLFCLGVNLFYAELGTPSCG